jgi:ATP-dependent DNA helicase RecQ
MGGNKMQGDDFTLQPTNDMNPPEQPLLPLLKKNFGFSSFRPLQEEIIRDALAGKDVFALLPTGGGKSLCFQLPALAREGLTLVISPLIALMKDQVDALQANGIPATFLNSSLTPEEARSRIRDLHNAKYRLLYIAPERAVLFGFLTDMVHWNIKLLAVDEAHCISEWGHDFRPEYRQLTAVRKLLPGVPCMALTATATERVREDIHTHLQLQNARNYVASFNRSNLSYKVIPKADPYSQLLTFLRPRTQESGIVYCQSRKTAETLSKKLNADHISAAPYHAGMEPADRTKHQELFLRDEVRVICATIAFGMGINKSNVRFVVHYDLPKNIEGYYQETGRAGRDGLPSECLLLFGVGDVMKQMYFIEEKEDEQQRQIAKTQLDRMVKYAESSECRRRLLLEYFGEEYPEASCDACDNCLLPRELYDGTIDAQKLLSCVLRIRESSGVDFGLRHIIEVLTGSNAEKILRWRHTELSTYGIGKNRSREEWMSVGRELMRLRLMKQKSENGFSVVEVTPAGVEALKKRSAIMLTKVHTTEETVSVHGNEQEFDAVLFECLRVLRKRIADERNVPAFVIFSDAALRQMSQRCPTTTSEFIRISGVGEKKLRDFGAMFMKEIERHLQKNTRKKYSDENAAPSSHSSAGKMNNTANETLKLFRSGKSVKDTAQERNLAVSTIYKHLLTAIVSGEDIQVDRFVTPEEKAEISSAFKIHGYGNITVVYEMLGGRFDYGLLRIVGEIETSRH